MYAIIEQYIEDVNFPLWDHFIFLPYKTLNILLVLTLIKHENPSLMDVPTKKDASDWDNLFYYKM